MLQDRQTVAAIIMAALAVILTVQSAPAQNHVVPQSGLHRALVSSSAARKQNIQQVERFLALKPVQKVVESSGYSLQQVREAVPSLNNQELARLAETSQKAENDFTAGSLTSPLWTLIILGAIVIVIILALKA